MSTDLQAPRENLSEIPDRRHADEALADSELLRATILQTALDAIICMDEDGRVLEFNPAAEKIFGFRRADVLGRQLAELIIPPPMRESHRRGLAEFLSTGHGAVLNRRIEISAQRADGSEFPVELAITPFREGDTWFFTGYARDITERKVAERRLAAQYAVTRILAEARTVEEAEPEVLRAVCENLGWRLGQIWHVDERAGVLRYTAHWHSPGDDVARFAAVSKAISFHRNQGLPGRVWASGRTDWIVDLAGEPGACRASVAWQCGIHAAFAFPILHEDRVLGILEFCHHQPTGRDEVLLAAIAAVGSQVGQFIERKRAEQALRESEADLAEAQRVARIGSWSYDVLAGSVRWSDELYRIFDVDKREFGSTYEAFLSRVHPDDVDRVVRASDDAQKNAGSFEIDYRIITRSGEQRHIREVGYARKDNSGLVTCLFGTAQDVTDRKRADEALALFRTLIDHTNDAIEVVDPATGRFLDMNDRACMELGYTREEYLSLSVPDIDPLVTGGNWLQISADRRQAGSTMFESVHRRKDGSTFPVEVNLTYVRLDRDYFLAVVRDISERRAAEAARERLVSILEATPDLVALSSVDGPASYINTAGRQLLGIGPGDVIYLLQARSPASRTRILEEAIPAAIRDGVWSGETILLNRAGEEIPVSQVLLAHKSPSGELEFLSTIARDLRSQRRLEEQLRQAQKMEAVGRLAGGVAHDFNNMLTIINGFSQLALDRIDTADPIRDALSEIRKAGDRAALLTRQLLTFSRNLVLLPQVVNVNDILGELLKLLGPLVGKDVDINLDLDTALGRVKIDVAHFEQAILNLVVNARDAMAGSGRLVIETRNVVRPEVLAPGEYVRVSVADTGHGMAAATKARVFEPFFTTKEPGKGTGLGLSMVYGFVQRSGGQIEVTSEPGAGTTFTMFLPCTHDAPAETMSLEPPGAPTGTETVLLVDDEDSIRHLCRRVLQSSGYTVLEARDGQDALAVAEHHPDAIHLLLTDLVMPHRGGRQLADQLSKTRPDTRVVIMSGYTGDAAGRLGALKAGDSFLQKPFTPLDLARKVREALDRA